LQSGEFIDLGVQFLKNMLQAGKSSQPPAYALMPASQTGPEKGQRSLD